MRDELRVAGRLRFAKTRVGNGSASHDRSDPRLLGPFATRSQRRSYRAEVLESRGAQILKLKFKLNALKFKLNAPWLLNEYQSSREERESLWTSSERRR